MGAPFCKLIEGTALCIIALKRILHQQTGASVSDVTEGVATAV